MSIDLTGLPTRNKPLRPLRFGGVMGSPVGGAILKLNRMGDRFAMDVETAPMRVEPEGRRWIAALWEADRLGGILPVAQLGFNVMSPGTPVVATATAAGRLIPVVGLEPFYPVRVGQWLNYIVGGRRYLEQATAQVIADAAGAAIIPIQNLLRVPLTAGATIDLAKPCIEGILQGDLPIDLPVEQITSFKFSILEAR